MVASVVYGNFYILQQRSHTLLHDIGGYKSINAGTGSHLAFDRTKRAAGFTPSGTRLEAFLNEQTGNLKLAQRFLGHADIQYDREHLHGCRRENGRADFQREGGGLRRSRVNILADSGV